LANAHGMAELRFRKPILPYFYIARSIQAKATSACNHFFEDLCERTRILNIGRPKLFVKDGSLYGILRNHRTADSPMELLLVKIHPETLALEQTVVLDDTQPKDGYYAEHYFDGDTFCVVTYKMTDTEKPDLVLLTFDWNELVKSCV